MSDDGFASRMAEAIDAYVTGHLSIDDACRGRVSRQALHTRLRDLGAIRQGEGTKAMNEGRRSLRDREKPAHLRPARRFETEPGHEGGGLALLPNHWAVREGRAIFPKRVQAPTWQDGILKSGMHNRKIGGRVLVGDWAGAAIYTLTLEERATCPRYCAHWRDCYGNAMHWPTRWVLDDTALSRLRAELRELDRKNRPFVVRLHVLGDFFSVAYVRFWRRALADFKHLLIYGYTARDPDEDAIGCELRALACDEPARFRMRWSRAETRGEPMEALPWRDGVETGADRGFVCPAQVKPGMACANCAGCWQSSDPVFFKPHGKGRKGRKK